MILKDLFVFITIEWYGVYLLLRGFGILCDSTVTITMVTLLKEVYHIHVPYAALWKQCSKTGVLKLFGWRTTICDLKLSIYHQ
jgi:hypothetical protein